jgi:hypothetical protein
MRRLVAVLNQVDWFMGFFPAFCCFRDIMKHLGASRDDVECFFVICLLCKMFYKSF